MACAWGSDLTFPPGFKFGAASAAYQIEGGWNASDKGESIWDRLVHENPEMIGDRSNGDVACDSYHLWQRDIEIASEIGLHFYRFSIAWTRILPTGFSDKISEDGKNYYNRLIDGLLEKGINPVISIYHWDLPQQLQDLGGWVNPLIVDWFSDYARVVFSLYADRVKTWITINEPTMICDESYNTGFFAPAILEPHISPYVCAKNVLLAHAKAWRIYDEEYRPKYNGEITLANHLIWYEPLGEEDFELTELVRQNLVGRYSHPVYSKEGGWPPSLEKHMEEVSRRKGFQRSVLPPFTREEIDLVKGTFDFYAMNHYTSRLVRKAEPSEHIGSFPLNGAPDLEAVFEKDPSWSITTSHWFYINPEGIRRQLAWLRKEYGDIKFWITENGLSTTSGLEDRERIEFYRDYLKEVLLAINEDGQKVTGYTAWTLMDNFEWNDGYNSKFGLYEVNFTSPMRTRRQRASARYYKQIIDTHSVPKSPYDDL
nr:myrosinase 1 isoform X2 [Bombyx mori]